MTISINAERKHLTEFNIHSFCFKKALSKLGIDEKCLNMIKNT